MTCVQNKRFFPGITNTIWSYDMCADKRFFIWYNQYNTQFYVFEFFLCVDAEQMFVYDNVVYWVRLYYSLCYWVV